MVDADEFCCRLGKSGGRVNVDSIFGGLSFCNDIVVTKKTVLDQSSTNITTHQRLGRLKLLAFSRRSFALVLPKQVFEACVFAGSSLMMMICGVAGQKCHFKN